MFREYGQIHKSTAGGRAAEAEAFARAAGRLHRACSPFVEAAACEDALQGNQKLWTLLQAGLADENNPIPDDLRRDILRLSVFVDKQTVRARAAPSMKALQPLIEINRNMAGGLFHKP